MSVYRRTTADSQKESPQRELYVFNQVAYKNKFFLFAESNTGPKGQFVGEYENPGKFNLRNKHNDYKFSKQRKC